LPWDDETSKRTMAIEIKRIVFEFMMNKSKRPEWFVKYIEQNKTYLLGMNY
jgi:hypothetical protein